MSLNILISYHYMSKKQATDIFNAFNSYKYKDDITFILDSGAFSAWNAGASINIDDYIDYLFFIDKFNFPIFAIQLDVVGDGQKTYDNFLYMQKKCKDLKNITLLPVIQRTSSKEIIDKTLNLGDYICLGNVMHDYEFIKYMNLKYPEKKFHSLAYTKLDKKIQSYSQDSSSFECTERFGRISFFDYKTLKFKTICIKDVLKYLQLFKTNNSFLNLSLLPTAVKNKIGTLAKSNSKDFITNHENIFPRLTLIEYIKAYNYMEQKNDKKYYLACNPVFISTVLSLYEFLKDNNYLRRFKNESMCLV